MTATFLTRAQADTYRVRPTCRCRPGCLSRLHPDDEVVPTPDGDALAVHVAALAIPAQLDGVQCGTFSPLSRVGAS